VTASGPSAHAPLALRLLILLAACTAVGPAALNVYLPSLPAVQDDFGVSLADVQATVSVPLVCFGLALVLLGPLSDRYGRRPTLVVGLVAFTAGSLLAMLAPAVGWITFARGLQSAGAAMAFISARAVVADLTPREHLARSVAQVTMIMLVSQMLAPMAGNLAMAVGGWRAIQAVAFAVGLLLVLACLAGLRETRIAAEDSRQGIAELARPTLELLRRGRFLRLLLQSGVSYAAFPAFISIAPHLMVAAFGRPATEYGYYFAVLPFGYFLGNAFVLRYGSRFRQSDLILAGGLLGVGACVLSLVLLAAGVWHPLALFLPAGTLLNIGLGFSLPAIAARAVSEAWPSTGAGWGLVGFAQQLVAATSVQLLAFLPSSSPFPLVWFCLALAALAALLELGGSRLSAEGGPGPSATAGP
jgi:DHA1 family bicyclomycin/chloramphenicol resistance-like MFS transporter